jgi:Lipase (class 3)
MLIESAVAPPYAKLRPLQDTATPTFPVHRDLVGTLATAEKHPDDTVAHVLATCAGYAYATVGIGAGAAPNTLATIMARLGLADNHCLTVGLYVDAMFISSTAFLVQSSDGRVVLLAYRGTQPLNFLDWLTDLDVNPEKVAFSFPDAPGPFEVHAGFYRNVRATRYEIVGALMHALDGRSVIDHDQPMDHPLEALYIAGHSLGGAMAAILAVMLLTERRQDDPTALKFAPLVAKLRGVYTFGQPMIGSRELAKACGQHEFLRDQVIRYIYRRDVIPHLPSRDSGSFAHFGQEYRYDGEWRRKKQPTEQLGHLGGVVEASFDLLGGPLRPLRRLPFHYSLHDHFPQHYISTLTPKGKPSEFGDYYYMTRGQ